MQSTLFTPMFRWILTILVISLYSKLQGQDSEIYAIDYQDPIKGQLLHLQKDAEYWDTLYTSSRISDFHIDDKGDLIHMWDQVNGKWGFYDLKREEFFWEEYDEYVYDVEWDLARGIFFSVTSSRLRVHDLDSRTVLRETIIPYQNYVMTIDRLQEQVVLYSDELRLQELTRRGYRPFTIFDFDLAPLDTIPNFGVQDFHSIACLDDRIYGANYSGIYAIGDSTVQLHQGALLSMKSDPENDRLLFSSHSTYLSKNNVIGYSLNTAAIDTLIFDNRIRADNFQYLPEKNNVILQSDGHLYHKIVKYELDSDKLDVVLNNPLADVRSMGFNDSTKRPRWWVAHLDPQNSKFSAHMYEYENENKLTRTDLLIEVVSHFEVFFNAEKDEFQILSSDSLYQFAQDGQLLNKSKLNISYNKVFNEIDIDVSQNKIFLADRRDEFIKMYDLDGNLLNTFLQDNSRSIQSIKYSSKYKVLAIRKEEQLNLIYLDSSKSELSIPLDEVAPTNQRNFHLVFDGHNPYLYFVKNTALHRVHLETEMVEQCGNREDVSFGRYDIFYPLSKTILSNKASTTNHGVKVFPNPSLEVLRVEADSDILNMYWIDMYGRKISIPVDRQTDRLSLPWQEAFGISGWLSITTTNGAEIVPVLWLIQ